MSKEALIFNIGGVVFETYRSTLLRMPTALADIPFLEEHYRTDSNDYFFDKDPDVFKILMNYLRSGQLFVPHGTCVPDMQNELLYWGVEPSVIDGCCSAEYKPVVSTINQVEGNDISAEVGPNRNLNIIWNILSNPCTSVGANVYAIVSYLFIGVSVISLIAVTTSPFKYNDVIGVIADDIIINKRLIVAIVDLVCLLFFTVEYILRVITAPRKPQFLLSFLGIVDVLALLQEYIGLLAEFVTYTQPFRFLRVFRIIRVFRICRLLKSVHGMQNLLYILSVSVVELVILMCFSAVGILVFATLVYFTDTDDVYSTFSSIPEALWWAIVTMTTVGYGDHIPITMLGRIVGSLCAVTGVLVIALSMCVMVSNAMLLSKCNPTNKSTAHPIGPSSGTVRQNRVYCARNVPI